MNLKDFAAHWSHVEIKKKQKQNVPELTPILMISWSSMQPQGGFFFFFFPSNLDVEGWEPPAYKSPLSRA